MCLSSSPCPLAQSLFFVGTTHTSQRTLLQPQRQLCSKCAACISPTSCHMQTGLNSKFCSIRCSRGDHFGTGCRLSLCRTATFSTICLSRRTRRAPPCRRRTAASRGAGPSWSTTASCTAPVTPWCALPQMLCLAFLHRFQSIVLCVRLAQAWSTERQLLFIMCTTAQQCWLAGVCGDAVTMHCRRMTTTDASVWPADCETHLDATQHWSSWHTCALHSQSKPARRASSS